MLEGGWHCICDWCGHSWTSASLVSSLALRIAVLVHFQITGVSGTASALYTPLFGVDIGF
jgi:hypothetical protein